MTVTAGYVTYYWQAASKATLQNILFTSDTDELGNPVWVPVIENLGVREGNASYGNTGTFYTCARSANIMETPAGCEIADPYIVSNLVGVWA